MKKDTLGLPDAKSRPGRADPHLPGSPTPLPPLSLASQGVLCQPSPTETLMPYCLPLVTWQGMGWGVPTWEYYSWEYYSQPGNII